LAAGFRPRGARSRHDGSMKDTHQLDVHDVPGGALLAVKVVPGSSRDRLAGVLGESLKIATAAPPEKGKANAAVARILARALGVGRRDVKLHAGKTSPRKEFHVAGLAAEEVRRRLAGL
jgi:uncharacterized protein (TIGR00251 family)